MIQTNNNSTTQPTAASDHAFPMLAAHGGKMPPNFRFMWVAR